MYNNEGLLVKLIEISKILTRNFVVTFQLSKKTHV